ncbi:homeobox-leucine zipper protein ATHB-40-like [Impatiens glandulifera]|uniref:homeobox-leucine zipper protein ATHB-40-like n=1 Tax=Impatiens glandulifera TaxID=253017 RepID=UPI001FB13224|nr:homeobox-leucine zipper protein ATHB-40-like [Impatiens glandulifera]
MTTSQVDDQMLLASQFYPGIYSQVVPDQVGSGETKPRRRRKKSKGEASASGIRKRKLSEEQVNQLEMSFGNEHKLESEKKDRLASELGLDPRQVAVWFQNRRARWKTKRIEEEYSKLKAEHESNVIDKCRLQSEVLRLKGELTGAEEKIQRLMEKCDGTVSNSPSSSFSMDIMEQQYFGEFGMEGLENGFFAPDNNNYVHGLEWASSFYM